MRQRKFYVDIMQAKSEVTGSFIICSLKVDEKSYLFAVDCGMYQEMVYESQNDTFPINPEKLDFVVLTHNHFDHNGRLPLLVKKGFYGPIYTTQVTRKILWRALMDNAKVIQDRCLHNKTQPYYTSEDVENTFPLVEGYEYNLPIRINENITCTFVPNGHLIGAACVLFQIHCPGEEDINLFFSGDYSNRNLFFKVPPIRKWITKLPINLITESTYGYMDSVKIKKVFHKNILKAIKQQKIIVIPVFSLGRAQEILYHLKELQSKYEELLKIPIYYDGKLSFYYTQEYKWLQAEGLVRFYQEKKDFLPENLTWVNNMEARKRVIYETSPKIIVTTSGMGNHGPAHTYIPAYVNNPNVMIHFTGYCAEGTMGRRLMDTEEGAPIQVCGRETEKRARVEFTNEFSAHAKADELMRFLKKFEKTQSILVNHGQNDTKKLFADRVIRELDVRTEILGNGNFYRLNSQGIVKSSPLNW